MSDISHTSPTWDVIIIGGGIAGLWTQAQLQQRGFATLLIEQSALGAEQTRCAQGIIHGGLKYSLSGELSSATTAIRAMPSRWLASLAGHATPDLSSLPPADTQYICTQGGFGARLAGLFAKHTLSSVMTSVTADQRPDLLKNLRGEVYQLDEPVIDVSALLHYFSKHYAPYQLAARVDEIGLQHVQLDNGLKVHTQAIVLCAGAGNAKLLHTCLPTAKQQLRPLHMTLLRGKLPPLHAHFLGLSDTPRLTVTSHNTPTGDLAWMIGGQCAEAGVHMTSDELIRHVRQELRLLLPHYDLSSLPITTFHIDRAEGVQANGKRPDYPVLVQHQTIIGLWPTKLAFAPMVADQVLERLNALSILPSGQQLLAPGSAPAVATMPWETCFL